jgi:holo-[acyl-carrier protein] synthase
MHCIGTDIIEIARIEQAIKRWGERFLHRVYTDSELQLYRQKPQSLAARFAGKEAVIKALNPDGKVISWKEIEILSDNSGQPVVRLYGRAQVRAASLGINKLTVSLSHSREYAIAVVIGESG